MSMPFLVVTGGSGFVARHVMSRLKENHGLALIRRHGKSSTVAAENSICYVENYHDFQPEGDAVLLHLGEPSHILDVDRQGSSHIDAMVRQAQSLCEQNYRHIVYASSTAVYGDHEKEKLSPSHQLVSGLKIYADAKIEVEKIIRQAGGTIARITNVYGPGMSEMNIFSDILKQLDGSGPVFIREATPIREYLWIDDLVDALLSMSQKKVDGTFNVSSGEAVSCIELARKVLLLAEQENREVAVKLADRESVLRLDISATEDTFDWTPQVNLEQGIKKLLKVYKNG